MKRSIWCFGLGACLALGFGFSSPGAGFIIIDEAHWGPGFVPSPVPPQPWPPGPIRPRPHPHVFATLELLSVNVQSRINDQVAATTVEQEFFNPGNARLEGTFIFPVPKGAHLDKFSMDIDGKMVPAELVAADKGRRIYEDIVRKARDPALLEYAGRDLFKVRIFPIEPRSKKRIKISYTQLLKADSGLIGYTVPLEAEKLSPSAVKNISVNVDLETRQSLKSIYSPTHAVEIKRHGSRQASVSYESSQPAVDGDFAVYFAPEKDEIGLNLLTHSVSGEDGYFLLLASPGIDAQEKQIVLKDVAFVLDTSGSMAGKKLEQAKKALQFCVDNLNEGDRFEIMRFSTEVEPLFNKLNEATKANRGKAEEFIKDLKAIGGTAIDDALRKALELQPGRGDSDGEDGKRKRSGARPFVIVFLTDGRPTIGLTAEDEIVANAKKRGHGQTRIFCFGIGTDVNTHLLDRISEDTHAFSQYVLPDEDLEIKVSSFYSKIKDPVLAGPTLKFTGDVRTSKLYPSPLPDLFKGEQVVLVGRYSGKGDSAVIVEGDVNGQTRKFTYEAKFAPESSENDFIPRLWATRRVGYLLDEIRLHGENPELRDEVADLARKYSIVTPYTAYLILEDEAQRNVPVQMRSLQTFNGDQDARREAAANWDGFKKEKTGDQAAFRSRYGLDMKTANAPSVAAASGAAEAQRALGLTPAPTADLSSSPATLSAGGNEAFRRRYGLDRSAAAKPDDGKSRLYQYSQQSHFVAGKSFFFNENQWTDSAIQKQPNAKRVRVKFGSPEYFDLLGKDSRVPAWLALGEKVQFLLNGTVYEITGS